MNLNCFPNRTIAIDDENYLYFGGTSYLGMATDLSFQSKISKAFKKWGTAYGSSRSSNIQLSSFDDSEAILANFIGAQAVLTVSSGTMAGKLVLEHLEKDHNFFFHYPKTHPAIIHRKSQLLFIDGKLNSSLQTHSKEKIVITVDAVLASEVEPTNFDFLNCIDQSKEVTLIIDESHSIGILGEQGWGIYKELKIDGLRRLIMISSLSKALGSVGGLIASDNDIIQKIRNEALFVGSSAMNPAYLSSIVESNSLLDKKRLQLHTNLNYLYEQLKPSNSYKFNRHYPVIYMNGNEVFEKLKAQKIIISSFKYPSYDEVMNRIVITSNHTKKDLKTLAKALIS